MTRSTSDSMFDGRGPPDECCPNCTSVRYRGEPSCSTCGRDQPASGWLPIAEHPDPFLGRVLEDRFHVTRCEGSGGHSSVYRARTEAAETVALKVARIGERAADGAERARKRMSREVRAVQMLTSPHIVSIHEFLELEEGPAAIVMDYVEGETAEERVDREGPFELERALEMVRQVAKGLSVAHRSGLLHRDIKPSNVMFEEQSDGSVDSYVTDFGVVRMQAASTLTQGFIGTPLYASPEQVRMEQLDPRTDVYSLGATLFRMLTGSPPFPHDTMMDVMRAHLEEPVPSVGAYCERSIPASVETLIGQMLAKERAERPDGARAVVERLERILTGVASPRTVRRHPSDPSVGDAATQSVSFDEARSSGSFTPAAVSTSDFAPLPDQTGEFSRDQAGSAEETRTGVQPLKSREAAELGEGNRNESSQRSAVPSSSSRFRIRAAGGDDTFLGIDARGCSWHFDRARGRRPELVAEHSVTPVDAALAEGCAWVGLECGMVEAVPLGMRPFQQNVAVDGPIVGVAAAADGTVGVLDVEGGFHWRVDDEEWCRRRLGRSGEHLVAAPEEPVFAVGDGSGVVQLVRCAGPTLESRKIVTETPETDLAVGPGGALVAVWMQTGEMVVRHVATDREVAAFTPPSTSFDRIYFTADGTLRGIGCEGGGVLLRDVRSGDLLTRFTSAVSIRRRR